jgi:5'-nucleotidase/UDP-sugar diphosphatase
MKFIIYLWPILLLSCTQLTTTGKEKAIKLTILHTNDHHGHFWPSKEGEYGLAARATLIKKIKQEVQKDGGHLLLLDAGDVNTGVPQSDLLDAEPDFKGMSAMGYDAMAIGNHEFDNSLAIIKKQQKEWAMFPFISANIYDHKKKRIFPSHIVKDIHGLRVVILGLTTEDTPKKSNPSNSKNIFFRPAVEEAKQIVPHLRQEADVLIAVTHTGHYADETHGADSPGDVTIARQATGLDLIIGGHTQKPLFKPDIQNGTIIVQAYEWGKFLGRIDLEILKKKVSLKNYQLIPVNLKESKEKILPDPQIESLLRPYKEKGDHSIMTEIGSTDGEFIGRREIIRSQKTNLGLLVATAYKEKFHADLSILNSGGIRDSLYPGQIRIESVLMVLPFGGEVVTSELTGAELKKYLEYVIFNFNPGSGSYPQMAGVNVVVNEKKKSIDSIKIAGKKIKLHEKYILALPEFIAKGGDNYPQLPYIKYGYIDADILMAFIKKTKTLKVNKFKHF